MIRNDHVNWYNLNLKNENHLKNDKIWPCKLISFNSKNEKCCLIIYFLDHFQNIWKII